MSLQPSCCSSYCMWYNSSSFFYLLLLNKCSYLSIRCVFTEQNPELAVCYNTSHFLILLKYHWNYHLNLHTQNIYSINLQWSAAGSAIFWLMFLQPSCCSIVPAVSPVPFSSCSCYSIAVVPADEPAVPFSDWCSCSLAVVALYLLFQQLYFLLVLFIVGTCTDCDVPQRLQQHGTLSVVNSTNSTTLVSLRSVVSSWQCHFLIDVLAA